MRALLLASVFALPVLFGSLGAIAQGSPSADQIIRALRPSGPLQTGTRGIRPASPGPAPTAAVPAAAPAEPRAAVAPSSAPQVAAVAPALPPVSAPQAPPAAAPSIDLTVQFQSGSTELTPDAMRTLDQLGQALSSEALSAFRFRIEGHTDTTGSRTVNMTLSQARAAKVAEYLQGRHGVAGTRLEPVGRGQEALKVQTPDQTSEPRNRRVQVVNIGA